MTKVRLPELSSGCVTQSTKWVVFVCLFVCLFKSRGLCTFFFFCFFLVFQDRVSLCSPSCLGTHSVDQAGLELRNSPVCLPSAGIKGMCHHARLPFLKTQLHFYYFNNCSLYRFLQWKSSGGLFFFFFLIFYFKNILELVYELIFYICSIKD